MVSVQACLERLRIPTGLRNGQSGEFHELVDGEGTDAHEIFVQSSSIFGRESLTGGFSKSMDEERFRLFC